MLRGNSQRKLTGIISQPSKLKYLGCLDCASNVRFSFAPRRQRHFSHHRLSPSPTREGESRVSVVDAVREIMTSADPQQQQQQQQQRPKSVWKKFNDKDGSGGKQPPPSQLHVIINGTATAPQQNTAKSPKSAKSSSGTAGDVETLAVAEGPSNKKDLSTTKNDKESSTGQSQKEGSSRRDSVQSKLVSPTKDTAHKESTPRNPVSTKKDGPQKESASRRDSAKDRKTMPQPPRGPKQPQRSLPHFDGV
jgi:hypothetical protein